MDRATSFLLTCLFSGALVAACGGAQPSPQGPETPPPSEGAPDGSVPPTTVPSPSAAPTGSAVPPTVPPMKPIAASAMAVELQNLGLDLKSLPSLEKLEPNKLRKVMRTFTKSLGAKCSDCHNESDYALMTPMKKIAMHMWNDYVRALAMDDGTALYCDSCHQGRMKFLDRHDKKALGAWMDQNYVAKLKRRDGKDHTCETCHGDPFEGDIFARWTQTPAPGVPKK